MRFSTPLVWFQCHTLHGAPAIHIHLSPGSTCVNYLYSCILYLWHSFLMGHTVKMCPSFYGVLHDYTLMEGCRVFATLWVRGSPIVIDSKNGDQ